MPRFQKWRRQLQFTVVIVMQIIEGTYNLPAAVMRKKGFQQVLLIPEYDPLLQPLLQVVFWRKYVMHMDYHTFVETRQYLKILKKDVALGPYDVRGINE